MQKIYRFRRNKNRMTPITETQGTNASKERIFPDTDPYTSSAPALNLKYEEGNDNVKTVVSRGQKWDAIAKVIYLLLSLHSASDCGTGKQKRLVHSTTTSEEPPDIEEKIETTYDEIKRLNKKLAKHPENEKLRRKLDKKHEKLEELQKQEAEQFEARFHENLEYPMGDGYETLKEAKQACNQL